MFRDSAIRRLTIYAYAFTCVCAIILLSTRAAAFSLALPADESDLYVLLEEQAIDSFQYEQLLVFYALPVSVPQGELAYLVRAFPEIEDLLPTPEELESYQPFDNRAVQRLLGDFPVLADFEPVLRFNTAQSAQPSSGEVIIGINKSPADELRGQRVRFKYKSQVISADGGIALSDTAALWQNRRVVLSYKDVHASIGNFKQPVPGELMYGRFASLNDSDKPSITSNWIYASSNTWNGASLSLKKIPGLPALGVTAFGHARPGERGGGGGIDVNIGKQWKAFAGVTGFEIGRRDAVYGQNDTDDSGLDYYDGGDDGSGTGVPDDNSGVRLRTTAAAHLYGEYKDKVWHAVTELGLPLDGEGMIPAVSLRLGRRIKNSSAEYRLTSYPENFSAPMSRVKRQTLAEIGIRDTALTPEARKHSLRTVIPIIEKHPAAPAKKKKEDAPSEAADGAMSIPFIDMVRLTPEIDFTESEGIVKRVYGKAELRARGDLGDVSLSHSSKIFTASPDSALHTSGASLYLRTGYPLDLRASYRRAYGYYRDARNTYALEFVCTAVPNTVIAPFVNGRYVTERTYRFGVKTELHLYKKTWTSITIEIPAGVKGDDNVYIKGSSSYAF